MAARPDSVTLAAFFGFVLIGGSNVVAVRLSNIELAPFWGATLRFGIAALLFVWVALWRRSPWPRGRALRGSLLYGFLNIALFYAFAYYALVNATSGFAAVVLGLVPLATYLLAVAQGLEAFRWHALGGATIALAGIAVVFWEQLRADVPAFAFVALLGATLSAAQASITVKRFPPVDPVAMNAIAMCVGTGVLFALSWAAGEVHALPERPSTVVTVLYLATIGGLGLFTLVLYVLHRWTASATSYGFVLFPVVATALGGWLAHERVTWLFVAGSLVALAGVYVGVLARRPGPVPAPPAGPGPA